MSSSLHNKMSGDVMYIALLLCTSLAAASIDCHNSYEIFANMLKTSQDQPDQLSSVPLLAYSGKYANDAGQYQLCKNQNDSSYMTIIMLNKTTFAPAFMIGVCGPAACSAADYFNSTIWDQASPVIQTTSNLDLFSPPSTLASYIPITLDPAEKYEMPSYFLVFGSVLLILFLLLIFSTVLKRFRIKNSSVVEAWAIQSNIGKLFIGINRRSNHDSNLEIFDGIRVITALWVYTVHFTFTMLAYAQNFGDTSQWKVGFEIEALKNCFYLIFYCVEPFFFMGGFLAAFSLANKLKNKTPSILNYLSCLSHRLIRVFPSYVLTVIVTFLAPCFTAEGPLRPLVVDWASDCKETWWKNICLIDNFLNPSFDTKPNCAVHGWYISNDMQIYLLLPIIIWIFLKSQKLGFGVILALIVGSSAFRMQFPEYKVYGWFFAEPQPGYAKLIYFNPLLRMAAYLIGGAAGLLYYNYKAGNKSLRQLAQKLQDSKRIGWLVELVGFIVIIMVMGLYLALVKEEQNYPNWVATWFNLTNRVAFGMGLVCVIAPTLLGSTTLVKRLLSARVWSLLSQLSFNFYLMHLPVLFIWIFGRDHTVSITPFSVMKEWLQVAGIALVLTVLAYFAVEMPFIELERLTEIKEKKKLKPE